ncbi:hypothetical protein MINTM005_12930 [Mycobacterium intracellulare]|nr:hypothetical protein MINTM005_12930 [Mycobacterium intracellulare]
MREAKNRAELAALPDLSVVQFWGEAVGDASQLVWQKDGDGWYSPGSSQHNGITSSEIPPQMFPARVLWVGRPLSEEGQRSFDEWAAQA